MSRVGTRTHVQCLQRWNKVLKSDLKKGHWTQQEDELLREIVQQNIDPSDPSRPLSWATIAVTIQGRTAKQCRERWMNHLDPTVNKGPWSAQEDKILLELQKQWGNQWASIASQLKGRTQNSVKIRWKTLQHKKKKNFYMDDYSSSNAESLHSSFESMPSQPSAPKQSPSPYPLPPADIQLNLKTGSIRGSLHISLQDTNNTDNNNTNNTNVNSNITNTTLPVLTNSSMGSNTIQLLRKSQEKAGTTKVNPIYALPQSVQFNIPSSLNTNISLNHNLRSYHNSADSNITMKSSHNSINNNNDTNNDISGNTFDDSSFPPLMNSFRTSFGAGFNSSFGLLNNSFGAGLNSYNPFATSSNFLSTSQNMYIPSDSQSSLSHSFTHIPSLFGSKNNMNNININNNNNNNVYLPPPSSSDISGMSSLHNSINGNYGNLSPPSNLPPIETPPPSSFFLPHINSQGNSLNNLVPPPLLSQNNNNMNMNNMNNMNNINNKFANTSLDIHVPIVVPSSNSTTIPMTLNTPSYIIGNMNNMNNNNMNNSNNMNNNNNMNMNNSNMNNNNMNNNNMNMNNNKESNGVYNHAGISTSFNDILTTFENNLTKSNKQFDMDSNIDIPITQPNEFILEGNNMDNNTNNNNNNNNNPYYYMNDMSQLLSPPENSNINQINLPNNGDYNNYNNNIDIMDHNLEETINTIPLYDNMLFDFNNNMNTLPSSNYIPENEPLTEEGQYNDENNSIDMIQMNNSLKDLTIDIPLQHHLNH
ncbi:hypothetical protein WA158_003792 [Blastocystis sp. Blastoise]